MSEPSYTIVPVTTEDNEMVLDHLRRFFFRQEPLNVYIKLLGESGNETCAELENYCVETILEGLSLMALSATGKVVGVSLNGSHEPGHLDEMQENADNCPNPRFRKILQLLVAVERGSEVFSKFPDVDRLVEVRILSVDTAVRGRGIAKALLEKSRVLRRIFGPKRDKVTGGWRKLHNEELHNLYSSPSIIRMIKSRRMRVDKNAKSPFSISRQRNITDTRGRVFKTFPEVPQLLRALTNSGYNLAAASRIEDIPGAYQLLHLFDITQYFRYKEIYPGTKTVHFNNLRAKTGIRFEHMIFFDDDKRNVRDVSRLGVTVFQVPQDGLTFSVLNKENRRFENVAQFRYLGTTITDQNLIEENIKRRLNSGNACYHSVQNLLSSHLLSKNIKFRIYKTIIFPVVLYGCETWSHTLREEHRLRVFENRMLRRIFGPKRDEVTGGWRKLHNEELHNLYSSPSIIRMIRSRRMRLGGHWGDWEDQGVGGWTILKWILKR
ncbi:hypothetical protein B7P43_G11475 [Cryptotermes secundus]|uniref:aralkylamine N-acetyltransferase n=1 Tax=Cryptotermes secundus TaxID=105785 RepID=A0A2J7PC07_9NEOP|nr:hypothetical protein B7P43_G11475 [Cryptotermes secundus]